MTAFEAPRLSGHPPGHRRGDRAGRQPRQAHRDRLGRRHVLHTHMRMTGLVAPVPARRALAQEHAAACGRSSRSRASRRCASTRRWWRPSGPGTSPATPAGGRRSGPTCATPDVDLAECVRAHPPVLRRVDHGGRAAARPAGRVRRRQRLQERGPVGLRRAPVHPGRRARRRDPRGRCRDGRRVPPGQPRPADPHDAPRQRRGRGGLRALRQAVLPVRHAPIEVRRHGEQSRVTYWCPLCQQRQDPLVPAWARADARPRSTSSPPATGAVRRPSCSTTPATSAGRSTRPTSCPRSSATRPHRRCWPASSRGARAELRRSAARPRARGATPDDEGDDDATGRPAA